MWVMKFLVGILISLPVASAVRVKQSLAGSKGSTGKSGNDYNDAQTACRNNNNCHQTKGGHMGWCKKSTDCTFDDEVCAEVPTDHMTEHGEVCESSQIGNQKGAKTWMGETAECKGDASMKIDPGDTNYTAPYSKLSRPMRWATGTCFAGGGSHSNSMYLKDYTEECGTDKKCFCINPGNCMFRTGQQQDGSGNNFRWCMKTSDCKATEACQIQDPNEYKWEAPKNGGEHTDKHCMWRSTSRKYENADDCHFNTAWSDVKNGNTGSGGGEDPPYKGKEGIGTRNSDDPTITLAMRKSREGCKCVAKSSCKGNDKYYQGWYAYDCQPNDKYPDKTKNPHYDPVKCKDLEKLMVSIGKFGKACCRKKLGDYAGEPGSVTRKLLESTDIGKTIAKVEYRKKVESGISKASRLAIQSTEDVDRQKKISNTFTHTLDFGSSVLIRVGRIFQWSADEEEEDEDEEEEQIGTALLSESTTKASSSGATRPKKIIYQKPRSTPVVPMIHQTSEAEKSARDNIQQSIELTNMVKSIADVVLPSTSSGKDSESGSSWIK